MQAKLDIGEVLLTAGILEVFGQFLVAVMTGDSALCQYRGETKPVLSRQFRGFAEGQETLRIQSNGQFLAQALFGFRLWNAQTACNRIGNAECDVHRLFRINDSKSDSVDLALELVCSVRSKGYKLSFYRCIKQRLKAHPGRYWSDTKHNFYKRGWKQRRKGTIYFKSHGVLAAPSNQELVSLCSKSDFSFYFATWFSCSGGEGREAFR